MTALDFLHADEALKVSAMTQDYVDIIEQAHLLRKISTKTDLDTKPLSLSGTTVKDKGDSGIP